MQAALDTRKIEVPAGETRKSWCAPQLRVESIAAITRGGFGTGVDNCSQTDDGLQCN